MRAVLQPAAADRDGRVADVREAPRRRLPRRAGPLVVLPPPGPQQQLPHLGGAVRLDPGGPAEGVAGADGQRDLAAGRLLPRVRRPHLLQPVLRDHPQQRAQHLPEPQAGVGPGVEGTVRGVPAQRARGDPRQHAAHQDRHAGEPPPPHPAAVFPGLRAHLQERGRRHQEPLRARARLPAHQGVGGRVPAAAEEVRARRVHRQLRGVHRRAGRHHPRAARPGRGGRGRRPAAALPRARAVRPAARAAAPRAGRARPAAQRQPGPRRAPRAPRRAAGRSAPPAVLPAQAPRLRGRLLQGVRPAAHRARDGGAVPALPGQDDGSGAAAPVPGAGRGGPAGGRVPRAQRPRPRLLRHAARRPGARLRRRRRRQVLPAERVGAAAGAGGPAPRGARAPAPHAVRGDAVQGAAARAPAPPAHEAGLPALRRAPHVARDAAADAPGAGGARHAAHARGAAGAGEPLLRRHGLQLPVVPGGGGAARPRGGPHGPLRQRGGARPQALPVPVAHGGGARRGGDPGQAQVPHRARRPQHPGQDDVPRPQRRGAHLAPLLLPGHGRVRREAVGVRDGDADGRVRHAGPPRPRGLQALRQDGAARRAPALPGARAARGAARADGAPARQVPQLPQLRGAPPRGPRHAEDGRPPVHEPRAGVPGTRLVPHGRDHAGRVPLRDAQERPVPPAVDARDLRARQVLRGAARHRGRLRLPLLLPRRQHPAGAPPPARALASSTLLFFLFYF